MAIKLSNVIGAPFSDFVLRQLGTRAIHNGSIERDPEEIMFLANKTAWVRLISSVDIVPKNEKPLQDYYNGLGVDPNTIVGEGAQSLAKSWILQAGTSFEYEKSTEFRYGLGRNGAYGLGGTEELGYRPMPGLTSVSIETTGRLGSLRQATVSFRVWNMNQLNVMEALYFRLGYSMLLEWGHTQYYKNNDSFVRTGVQGIDDPFKKSRRKEDVQQDIAKKVKESDGNYDGMLAIVTNFEWTFNQEGGYDCTLRLIGLGAVMESLRINQNYKLPEGALEEYKQNQQTLQEKLAAERAENARLKDALKNPPTASQAAEETLPVPTTVRMLHDYAKRLDKYDDDLEEFVDDYSYYPAYTLDLNKPSTVPDYYYVAEEGSSAVNEQYNAKYFGLFQSTLGSDKLTRYVIGQQVALNKKVFESVVGEYVDQLGKDNPDIKTTLDAIPFNNLTGRQYTNYGRVAYMNTGITDYGEQIADTFDALPTWQKWVVGVLATPAAITAGAAVGLIGGAAAIIGSQITWNVKLDDLVEGFRYEIKAPYNISRGAGVSNQSDNEMYFEMTVRNLQHDITPVTRLQLVEAVDQWFSESPRLELSEIDPSGFTLGQELDLTLTSVITIPNVKGAEGLASGNANLEVRVKTNNVAFLQTTEQAEKEEPPVRTEAQPATDDSAGGTVNDASSQTAESEVGFESALQAMLVVVKTKAQTRAINEQIATVVDITEDTKLFYNDGVLKGVFNATTPTYASIERKPYNVLNYALKGFNSALMLNSSIYDTVPTVAFTNLAKAYVVKYPQGGTDEEYSQVYSPVYITLGYLLAFLNNMCLVYDNETADTTSKTSSNKHPYVYIDFNPETNLCLTSPKQLSIDPFTCLIPFNAAQADYKQLFPKEIAENLPLFNPVANNVLTQVLNASGLTFKASDNPYQGKMMNILLNTDYLLSVVSGMAASSNNHAVILRSFLDRVLVDVNKSLGGMNQFRTAYRDESNTIQIVDDQWVPKYKGESTVIVKSEYKSRLETDPILAGQLPVFGSMNIAGQERRVLSLTRRFQLKTVTNTRLASVVAISAQANTGSVNASDHSPFSWINGNYQDRYKRYVQNVNGTAATDQDPERTEAEKGTNDQKAAERFNKHISSMYGDVRSLDPNYIESARNYYIERMSDVKAADPITSAAPFIPVEVELEIDGISGIIMGNAFTIPEDRLPLSMRGEGGVPKIGFITTGLSHRIESNQWLTTIKGQPIKFRDYAISKGATVQVTDASLIPQAKADKKEDATKKTTVHRKYPGSCADYSGAPQVLAPDSVNTKNFKTYYPDYTFVKGVSDIRLPAGVTPLTEAGIIDDTAQNRFNIGTLASPLPYFVIHHTGGRGNVGDVYSTFYCRGLPAQYVIDREGRIHRFMPDGAKAYHAGKYNSISIGVEIIARKDSDVLPVQVTAAVRLAHFLGFKKSQVVGHGDIASHKQRSEGATVVNLIRSL